MVYTIQNEREVNSIGAFENTMDRRKRRQIRFFLMLPTLLALLLGLGTYVFTYHVNQFSMALELSGEKEITLASGEHFEDPGATAVFSGTHLFQDGRPIDVTVEGAVDETKIGTYQLHYRAEHLDWQAETSPNNEAEFVSEQLAEIYAQQGLFDQAKETYRKLSLLYPKKSIYFAELIEKLDKENNN